MAVQEEYIGERYGFSPDYSLATLQEAAQFIAKSIGISLVDLDVRQPDHSADGFNVCFQVPPRFELIDIDEINGRLKLSQAAEYILDAVANDELDPQRFTKEDSEAEPEVADMIPENERPGDGELILKPADIDVRDKDMVSGYIDYTTDDNNRLYYFFMTTDGEEIPLGEVAELQLGIYMAGRWMPEDVLLAYYHEDTKGQGMVRELLFKA